MPARHRYRYNATRGMYFRVRLAKKEVIAVGIIPRVLVVAEVKKR